VSLELGGKAGAVSSGTREAAAGITRRNHIRQRSYQAVYPMYNDAVLDPTEVGILIVTVDAHRARGSFIACRGQPGRARR
jgi:hypothetical protein